MLVTKRCPRACVTSFQRRVFDLHTRGEIFVLSDWGVVGGDELGERERATHIDQSKCIRHGRLELAVVSAHGSSLANTLQFGGFGFDFFFFLPLRIVDFLELRQWWIGHGGVVAAVE